MERHHAPGPERVHLLGWEHEARADPRTPHSPDAGGAGRSPLSALLLARVQPPWTHRQV